METDKKKLIAKYQRKPCKAHMCPFMCEPCMYGRCAMGYVDEEGNFTCMIAKTKKFNVLDIEHEIEAERKRTERAFIEQAKSQRHGI